MKKLFKKLFRTFNSTSKQNNPISDTFSSENTVPNYSDAFQVQKTLSHSTDEIIIFDVGGHEGQSVLHYNHLFQGNCKMYSFDPFFDSFRKLLDNTSTFGNVFPVNKALGDKTTQIDFHINTFSMTNSILPTDEKGHDTWGNDLLNTIDKTEVEMTTLDEYIEICGISKIDILKLDTQGSEYLVLEGAKRAFEKGIIKLVYTEIITMPTYTNQKNFYEILELFHNYGFELFNIYNQSTTSYGKLRQVDAIFIKK